MARRGQRERRQLRCFPTSGQPGPGPDVAAYVRLLALVSSPPPSAVAQWRPVADQGAAFFSPNLYPVFISRHFALAGNARWESSWPSG